MLKPKTPNQNDADNIEHLTKYLGAVQSSPTTSNQQKIETTKPFFSLKNTRNLSTNCQFCQQNKMNKTTKNRPTSETDYQTNKNPRALSSIDSKSRTCRLRFFSSAPWCRCPSNKKCWKSNNFTQRKPLCFVTNTDLQKEKNDPTTGQVRNRKNLIKLIPSAFKSLGSSLTCVNGREFRICSIWQTNVVNRLPPKTNSSYPT